MVSQAYRGLESVEGFDAAAYIGNHSWQKSHYGLERIEALLEALGRPQDRCRFVHVAGTNGKGSVCSYIASGLQAAGLHVGLFTSPGIYRIEDRIRIDGAVITHDDFTDVVKRVARAADSLADEMGEHATEFELMCAVALLHFAEQACDIAVLEVGLGGRLDATNVIEHPEVCVLTRLGLDHTDLLGSTLEQIAAEKAAICKPGAAVVSWPYDDSVLRVVREAAGAVGDEVVLAALDTVELEPLDSSGMRCFEYRSQRFRTRLAGSYQPYNAALAIEALYALKKRGWAISDAAVAEGIERAVWPGRFEILPSCGDRPTVVLDGGHNPQGAKALADSLADSFAGTPIVFVMSVLADKDYRAMLAFIAPYAAHMLCVTASSARALSAEDLARAAQEVGIDAHPAADFSAALSRACAIAGQDGIVCVFGSLYSLADAKRALDKLFR